MKIARKLITGFLVVAVIAGIIGGVGIAGILQLKNQSVSTYEQDTKPLEDIFAIVSDIYQMRLQLRTAVINCDNIEEVESAEKSYNDLAASYKSSAAKYSPTIKSKETKALFDEGEKLFDESFDPVAQKTFELARQGKQKEANSAGATGSEQITKMISNYNEALNNAIDSVNTSNKTNTKTANMLTIIPICVIAVGLAASIFLGRIISKMISQPINKLVDAANEIAIGATDVSVTAESNDEIGMLAHAFNKMIIGIKEQAEIAATIRTADFTLDVTPRSEKDTLGIALKGIVESLNADFIGIKDSAEQIALGSDQVSNGAQSLSQGATEQASSIEELSASISQVSSQINTNVDNIKLASEYVSEAESGVNQSNEQMKNMLTAMENINNSSNEISKIIKVIDDIAFQTNILALNAAVEAARAGNAGKGFAVVADEVRNLASKSADAAKQTTALIEDSISIVSNGTKIAQETAVSLAEVEVKARLATETMDKIAIASGEQADAVSQINVGVEQIASVVQTNSATAEESAASSEELSGQAASLQKMVSKMKLTSEKTHKETTPISSISLEDSVDNNYSSYPISAGKYQ